ncbi:hypothetical protein A3K69_06060 [Candidatus Bathyarchaeota archaeon RBG_16_57_9]|nr:MAG: hypothetical protein A3K69_06060 [Candidatus Bathyarchaeota archaeon RBG_16_57_9]OGD53259.1 MAG: hypothetical protein A3K81_02325 [Candidatus Bathyarchaeota archaeon RBG_13_60_20]
MRIAVVADDLTGALDTGVQFKAWGLSVEVAPTMDRLSGLRGSADVMVVNTDSRGDEPELARRKVREASEALSSLCEVFYKKVDSTLRGNVGAELDAVMEATGSPVAVVAPAYPSNGRVTRGGCVYVNDAPLQETEYASEVALPSSYIPEIMGAQTRRKAAHIPLRDVRSRDALHREFRALRDGGYGVVVIDAEAERDLLAAAGLPVMVFCGSAGLASELPEGLGLRAPRPALTVCGSTRSLSREQVRSLVERLGATQVNLDTVSLLRGGGATDEALVRAEGALSSEMHVALVSAPDAGKVEVTRRLGGGMGLSENQVEKRVVESLSEITVKLVERHKLSGMVLTGGATALAVFKGLGVESVEITGEAQPGVPVLTLSNGLRAVTKAGGFGSGDALVEAVKHLKRLSA